MEKSNKTSSPAIKGDQTAEQAYKPTQSKEEAQKALRTTYLAVKGIEAQREAIVKNANEQIDALNKEEAEIAEQNARAAKDLEYYQEKAKAVGPDTTEE